MSNAERDVVVELRGFRVSNVERDAVVELRGFRECLM